MEDFKYELVDLGLPSGTLWMDRNIGASSPKDAGLYFAWGETQGYEADEVGKIKQFSSDDYKYKNSIGMTVLETTNDAVTQNISECHIPTKEQIIELLKETDIYCIKADGTEVHGTWYNDIQSIIWDNKIDDNEQLSGVEFRKKTDSSINIFVPYVGYGYKGSIVWNGLIFFLWSNVGGSIGAWGLGSYCDKAFCTYVYSYYGSPLRGVKNKEN